MNLYIYSAYIYCPYALNICLIIILEQAKSFLKKKKKENILHEKKELTKIKMYELINLLMMLNL